MAKATLNRNGMEWEFRQACLYGSAAGLAGDGKNFRPRGTANSLKEKAEYCAEVAPKAVCMNVHSSSSVQEKTRAVIEKITLFRLPLRAPSATTRPDLAWLVATKPSNSKSVGSPNDRIKKNVASLSVATLRRRPSCVRLQPPNCSTSALRDCLLLGRQAKPGDFRQPIIEPAEDLFADRTPGRVLSALRPVSAQRERAGGQLRRQPHGGA